MPLAAAVALLLLMPAGGLWRPGVTPARAGETGPLVSAEIRLGYAGYVTPNVWMPVTAVLRADRDLRGILEVAAPHPRSSRAARVQVEVHLSAATPRTVTVPVVVYDLRAPLTIRLLEGGRAAGEWRVAISPSRIVDRLILALSDRPVGIDRLVAPESRMGVAYVDPDALPARWQLYEGVRALVIRDLEERRVTPTQGEALSGWIAAGGHLVLTESSAGALRSAAILGPLLQGAARAPAIASAPERHHLWGRGVVTVVPVDPFVPTLSPEATAVWQRVLARGEAAALMERSLLDVLPHSGGTSAPVQLLIVLLLGGYLVALRPITRWLGRGASGAMLAVLLLAGVVGAAALLAGVARTQLMTLIQGAVAETLTPGEVARLDALGRIVLPRGGTFVLRAAGETLVRPLAESDTTLRLSGVAALEGRATATLPVAASALIALPVRGSAREDGASVAVTIRNRTGATLGGAVVLHGRRIQSIGPVGAEVSAVLAAAEWRPLPFLDVARGPRARLLAWTLARLADGAIIDPTTGAATFLVAWLDDAAGLLRWHEQRPSLLVVVPLAGMGESP